MEKIGQVKCYHFLIRTATEPEFVNVEGAQESTPRNSFYVVQREGTTKRVVVHGRQATEAGRIDSLETIPGLLECLQILARLKHQLVPCRLFYDDLRLSLRLSLSMPAAYALSPPVFITI